MGTYTNPRRKAWRGEVEGKERETKTATATVSEWDFVPAGR
jgi:hypothetical protein